MIESYTKKMQHVTSNGYNHLLEQTCYRCTDCGEVWEPCYYGQDGRIWDGSWKHNLRCPKKPLPPTPAPQEKAVEFDPYDF